MKRKLFRIDNETRPSKTLKTSKNESIETSTKSNAMDKIMQSFEQLKIVENENKSTQIELIETNEEVILGNTSDEGEVFSYTSSEILSMRDELLHSNSPYDEFDSEDVYVYTGTAVLDLQLGENSMPAILRHAFLTMVGQQNIDYSFYSLIEFRFFKIKEVLKTLCMHNSKNLSYKITIFIIFPLCNFCIIFEKLHSDILYKEKINK
jgi:hypothetical protein